MAKQLKDMNVEELKAKAYDVLVMSQKLQTDLNILNQLIANKLKPQPVIKENIKTKRK